VCGASLVGKRPHATFCSRRCKTRASDQRRKEDGRAKERDRRRYRTSEGDHRREYAQAYYEGHRERQLAVRKAWRASHPAQRRSYAYHRAARMAANGRFLILPKDWRRTVARFNGRCAYCAVQAPLLVEHVIPIARGGRHSIGNLLPACRPCNTSKGQSLVVEWRARLLKRGGDRNIHPLHASTRT